MNAWNVSENDIRNDYLKLWELNDILNAIVSPDDGSDHVVVDLRRLPDDRRDAILRRWQSAFSVIDRERNIAVLGGRSERECAEALLRAAPDLIAPGARTLSAKIERMMRLIIGAAGGTMNGDNDGFIGYEVGMTLMNSPELHAEANDALKAIAEAAANGDVAGVAMRVAPLVRVMEEVGSMMSPPGYVFFSGDDCSAPMGWIADGASVLREFKMALQYASKGSWGETLQESPSSH